MTLGYWTHARCTIRCTSDASIAAQNIQLVSLRKTKQAIFNPTMATNGQEVSSSRQQPPKGAQLDVDDAFSSGEDEPDTLDLGAAVAASRRQLEEHERTASINEHHQADNAPTSAVTPAWSIHAYTGASTSTIDLALEPETRSPFAQDTFSDEDVLYTRRPLASPDEAPTTSPTEKNPPPHRPVRDIPTLEISAVSLQEVPLQSPTRAQGPAPAFGDRRESLAPQSSYPPSHEQASTTSRIPVEIHVPALAPSETVHSPKTPFDEKFKQMKKSTGPSALEKVLNRTRPTHLPPKPLEEDAKHQKDWEEMMRLSREAGMHDTCHHERIFTETGY
jgi:hypothetical protein